MKNKIKSSIISYVADRPNFTRQYEEYTSVVNSYVVDFVSPQSKQNDARVSFSSMFALREGFSLVVFSKTHRFIPTECVIHNGMGVRIILQKGMCLIWNGSLIHCGAKSSTNEDGEHMKQLRLFNYWWMQSQYGIRSTTKREDSKELHRHKLNVCPHYDRLRNICPKCDIYTQKCINLSTIDMNEYEVGQKIVGDIKDDGWIVVKGNHMSIGVFDNIENIAYDSECWYPIEKNTTRQQKYDSTCEVDKFKLQSSKHTNSFMELLKTTVFDLHAPSVNYIIGKTNLLRNNKPIMFDQWPHSDFRHEHEE